MLPSGFIGYYTDGHFVRSSVREKHPSQIIEDEKKAARIAREAAVRVDREQARERRRERNKRPGKCARCGARRLDRRRGLWRLENGQCHVRVCQACLKQQGFPVVDVDTLVGNSIQVDPINGKTVVHYDIGLQLAVAVPLSINVRDNNGNTPLDRAVQFAHPTKVSNLLSKCPLESVLHSTLSYAMYLAICRGHSDVLTTLWKYCGANRALFTKMVTPTDDGAMENKPLCIDNVTATKPAKRRLLLARLLLLGAYTNLGQGVPEHNEPKHARACREAFRIKCDIVNAAHQRGLFSAVLTIVLEYGLDLVWEY